MGSQPVTPDQGVVALVGLGRMGLGMLRTLRGAGYEVHGWDLDASAREAAAAAGAEVPASAAAAVAAAGVVLLSLPRKVVEEALTGAGGLAGQVAPGTVVVDTSTLPPELSNQLAGAVAEHGAAYLAAPVSGGTAGAESGGLAVLAGGERAAFERARPVLETIGSAVFHFDSPATASELKLVHQAIFYGSLAIFTEAVRTVDGDADPEQICAALEQCVARNNPVAAYGRDVLARDHDSGQFPVSSALAELQALGERADGLRLDAPVIAAVIALFDRTVERGHGGRNLSSISEEASCHT